MFICLQAMAPPAYNDLGSCARDLFNKGYHFGLMSLNLKTKTKNGVEFTSGGNATHETGKVTASLQSKYQVKQYGMWFPLYYFQNHICFAFFLLKYYVFLSSLGLTFVEKWNTNNVLTTEISMQDYLVNGLKIAFDSSFAPQTRYFCLTLLLSQTSLRKPHQTSNLNCV